MHRIQLLIIQTVLILGGTLGDTSTKIWRRNMNFGNSDNWDGLDPKCGNQIFSFPSYMEPAVITLPSTIKAKQIILPSDGYVALQPGLTTFADVSQCPPKEAVFKRQGPLDWFDPENWAINGSSSVNKAIGHVERVPCQFDAIQFPANSSFSVRISQAATVKKFYWGNESLSHADVGLLMSSPSGAIQFRKKTEIPFGVTDSDCSERRKDCVCSNYQDNIKRHICSLTTCKDAELEERCPNPITPHGFCCPICGFHIKFTHRSYFSLESTARKLDDELQAFKGSVDGHVTRYKETAAHIILLPSLNVTGTQPTEVYGVALKMKAFLRNEPDVLDVTVSKSWEHLDGYFEASSGGMSSAGLYFLVLFIVVLLAGAALFIFYWRQSGFTVTSLWPSCPTITIPTGLTNSGSTPSFAFARFANERISHLNLRPDFGETIERAERVDTEVQETTEVSSPSTEAITVEFSNDAYEAVVDEVSSTPRPKGKSEDSQPLVEAEHVYDLIEVEETSAAVLSDAEGKVTTEE